MIEKISLVPQERTHALEPPWERKLMEKVNEIIDAVNTLTSDEPAYVIERPDGSLAASKEKK